LAVICNNCGKSNKESSKFCYSCGSFLLCEISSILNKRYHIIELIKSGRSGAIYRAKDIKLDILCVIKELFENSENPSIIERFEREAMILAGLKHNNLPGVIDYFVLKSRYYLVMDLVDGEDFLTILKKQGTPGLPEEQVILWSIEILKVIEFLHSHDPPIIYRDIKPSNVMLHKDGRVILIDFGIARTINPGSAKKKTAVGTNGYAPGEQYFGKAEPRSDLYAMGATMHHLLTGKDPRRFKFEPIKNSNPEITPELDDIVMKALQYEVSKRFDSAKEMREHLEKLLKSKNIACSEEKKSEYRPRLNPENSSDTVRKIVIITGLLMLFLLGLLYLIFKN